MKPGDLLQKRMFLYLMPTEKRGARLVEPNEPRERLPPKLQRTLAGPRKRDVANDAGATTKLKKRHAEPSAAQLVNARMSSDERTRSGKLDERRDAASGRTERLPLPLPNKAATKCPNHPSVTVGSLNRSTRQKMRSNAAEGEKSVERPRRLEVNARLVGAAGLQRKLEMKAYTLESHDDRSEKGPRGLTLEPHLGSRNTPTPRHLRIRLRLKTSRRAEKLGEQGGEHGAK